MPSHDHFAKAMNKLSPGAQWAIHSGTDVETGKPSTILQWHDPVVACPDHNDIVALAQQIEAEANG